MLNFEKSGKIIIEAESYMLERKRMRLGWFAIVVFFVLREGVVFGSDKCISRYRAAEKEYKSLVSSSRRNFRHNWEKVISEFIKIERLYPACDKADDSLYMAGRLFFECYKFSGLRQDALDAISTLDKLVEKYPKSELVDDGILLKGEIYLKIGEKERAGEAFALALKKSNDKNIKEIAQKRLKALPQTRKEISQEKKKSSKGYEDDFQTVDLDALIEEATASLKPRAQLLKIRYWTTPEYTRIVLDLDSEIDYETPHLLKADPELKTPPRLYLDLLNVSLSEAFRKEFPSTATPAGNCYELPIGDGLLQRARVAQYKPDVVRVVLDIESIGNWRSFPLPKSEEAGYRMVIDVYGEKKESASFSRTSYQEKPELKVSSTKRTIIVLDPGHGGKDPGAIGKEGTREKDITLKLARSLKDELEGRIKNVDVYLTRNDDSYISLVERTAKANSLKAHLFISIHCNADPDHNSYGIETYYLDNTTDRAALKLAARENFVPLEKMTKASDITNQILADMITTTKVNDSIPLANSVQKEMVEKLAHKYSDIKNLGVKKAPFWVLTGATMPCILLEVGFISYPREEQRLRSIDYQRELSRAIADGILNYLEKYPPLD